MNKDCKNIHSAPAVFDGQGIQVHAGETSLHRALSSPAQTSARNYDNHLPISDGGTNILVAVISNEQSNVLGGMNRDDEGNSSSVAGIAEVFPHRIDNINLSSSGEELTGDDNLEDDENEPLEVGLPNNELDAADSNQLLFVENERIPRLVPSHLHQRRHALEIRQQFEQLPPPQAHIVNQDDENDPLMVEAQFQANIYFILSSMLLALPMAFSLLFGFHISSSNITSSRDLNFGLFIVTTSWATRNILTRPVFKPTGVSTGQHENSNGERIFKVQLRAIGFANGPLRIWILISNISPPADLADFLLGLPVEPLRLYWDPQNNSFDRYKWLKLILKCYFVSFLYLTALNTILCLYRLVNSSSVFREIFFFELTAHLLAVVYIIIAFIVINFAAPFIASIKWLWYLFLFAPFSWIALVLVGVLTYPEITLPRSYGLQGYSHLKTINQSQNLLGMMLFDFLKLLRFLCLTVISIGAVPSQTSYKDVRHAESSEETHFVHPITIQFVLLIWGAVDACKSTNLVLLRRDYDEQISRIVNE